jgi:hypothetical protein
MAKYEITRACGHIEAVDITGPNTRGQRDHQARREAQRTCGECRQAGQAAVNAESARVATETELPTLTGSERQVAWAQTIRLAGLVDIADSATRLLGARYPTAVDTLTSICTRLALAHTDAAWWIEHRSSIYVAAKQEMTHADKLAVKEATQ